MSSLSHKDWKDFELSHPGRCWLLEFSISDQFVTPAAPYLAIWFVEFCLLGAYLLLFDWIVWLAAEFHPWLGSKRSFITCHWSVGNSLTSHFSSRCRKCCAFAVPGTFSVAIITPVETAAYTIATARTSLISVEARAVSWFRACPANQPLSHAMSGKTFSLLGYGHQANPSEVTLTLYCANVSDREVTTSPTVQYIPLALCTTACCCWLLACGGVRQGATWRLWQESCFSYVFVQVTTGTWWSAASVCSSSPERMEKCYGFRHGVVHGTFLI